MESRKDRKQATYICGQRQHAPFFAIVHAIKIVSDSKIGTTKEAFHIIEKHVLGH